MSFNDDTQEATAVPTLCFRLGRQYLVMGVVGCIFFLALDVASVYVAYWNVDGSFEHPKTAAVIFGVGWSLMVLLSSYLILAYYRERLFLTSNAITQHGCIRIRSIRISDATQIEWSRLSEYGRVVIRSHKSRIRIHLGNFTRGEQDQLIAIIRGAFAQEIQNGWTKFAKSRLPQDPKRLARQSLRGARICASLLFLFGGVFGYSWLAGLGNQWLLIGVLNVLGGGWFVWRIFKRQDVTLPEESA